MQVAPRGRTVVPILLENAGEPGDYGLAVEGDVPNAELSFEVASLVNFGAGSKRTAYLDVNADGAPAGVRQTVVSLSSPSGVVFSRDVCLAFTEVYSVTASFEPSRIVVPQAGSFATRLVLENNGNNFTRVTVRASSALIEPESQSFSLQPGEQASFDVVFDARDSAGGVETRVVEFANSGAASVEVTLALLGADYRDAQIIAPASRIVAAGQRQNFTVIVSKSLATGHYAPGYSVTRDYDNAVVARASLSADVVPAKSLRGKSLLAGVGIAGVEVTSLEGDSVGFVNVVVENGNAYAVSSVVVYLYNLPSGVVSRVVAVGSLDAFEQKIVPVEVVASSAGNGLYRPTAAVDYYGGNVARQFELRVGPEPREGLAVEVSVPRVGYYVRDSRPAADVTVKVSNGESAAIDASAFFVRLPAGFSQDAPSPQVLLPGGAKEFIISIFADAPGVVNVTLSVEALGKSKKVTVPLDFPRGASQFTGFAVAGGEWLLALVLLLALVAAAFLLLSASNKRRAAQGA